MDGMEVNEENLESFTISDVNDAVGSIKHGFDAIAANNLIRYFHYRFCDGTLFEGVKLRSEEKAFLEYVSHAFSLIVTGKPEEEEQTDATTGKSADVAFGLTLGRGKYQREDATERDMKLAACVILLMREEGKTWEFSIDEAATRFYAKGGSRVAEEAYQQFGWALKHISTKDLRAIVEKQSTPQS